MKHLLIIDDEPNVLKSLNRSLRQPGWSVHTFSDPNEALNFAAQQTINLVISDYRMPRMDGVTFLKEIRAVQPETFRIVLSGQADMGAVLQAINEAEIYRFVTKPWSDADLKVTIQQALNHQEILQENRRLADLIRKQQVQIDQQKSELERLETECPGITQVNWGPDGSIILSEEDLLG